MIKLRLPLSALLMIACAQINIARAAESSPAPAQTADKESDKLIAEGRELFQKKDYAAALTRFACAIEQRPGDRDALLLAGLAAYWARKPAIALKYWNSSLDGAKRNTPAEWDVEQRRVLALHALNQPDAAEQVVERLYEIRNGGKVKPASEAVGFVREHVFLKDARVGVYEFFDPPPGKEAWTFRVSGAGEKSQRTFHVTFAADGNAFTLVDALDDDAKTLKSWDKRPSYADVRARVISALTGQALPADATEKSAPFPEHKVTTGEPTPFRSTPNSAPIPNPTVKTPAIPPLLAKDPPAEAKTPAQTPQKLPEPPVKKPEPARELTAAQNALKSKIDGLKAPAEAQPILSMLVYLWDVEFDISLVARINDPAGAERLVHEFNQKFPHAQEDASLLVDAISKAPAPLLKATFAWIPKLGARKPYLDFILLTGIYTRGTDAPVAFVSDATGSSDFMVSKIAASILARGGDISGLEVLFALLEKSDAQATLLLADDIAGLVRGNLPPAPSPDSSEKDLKNWRSNAARWWAANKAQLKFKATPEPAWSTQ
jgi:hypothetical protein